jgi:Tn3 transposase DDE domain
MRRNDFLCYGRQGIFATNSREQQEISTLCLQLLQNCLMLINTLLVEWTVAKHQLLSQLSEADRRALSPLLYEHVNPYGLFALDLNRPSLLEVARWPCVSRPKRWPESWCGCCALSIRITTTSRKCSSTRGSY